MRKRILTLMLAVSIFMTGCGTSTTSVTPPELLEPLAVTESFRYVERGDVGRMEVANATVKPKPYAHFFSSAVTIEKIVVQPGDYVKKGDVLAYADIRDAQTMIDGYNESISSENMSFNLTKSDFDQQITELLSQKAAADSDIEKNQIDVQIAVVKENLSYATILHNRKLDAIYKLIEDTQKYVKDGTLCARHDGQVMYTQDIYAGWANANEAVVIVVDTEDKYLELEKVNVNDYAKYSKAISSTIVVDGEQVEVEQLSFLPQELAACMSQKKYPMARLTCDKMDKMEIGESYPVTYYFNGVNDCLRVSNDSIYNDGVDFVYIMNDEGKRERREVELGIKDSIYSEVISGLSENEKVYYASSTMIPSSYKEIEVVSEPFKLENHAASYALSETQTMTVEWPSNGEITYISKHMSNGAEVKKGELLCKIKSSDGIAAITEAKYKIQNMKDLWAKDIKALDDQIAELRQYPDDEYAIMQIADLQSQKDLLNANYQNQIADLEKAYEEIAKNNDGNGTISVYAPISGEVDSFWFSEGDYVEKGWGFRLTDTKGDLLKVTMRELKNYTQSVENVADIGERITITLENGDIEYGTCVGNAVTGGIYPVTIDGRTVISTVELYDEPAFYVKLDNPDIYPNLNIKTVAAFDLMNMNEAIVIPDSVVMTEKNHNGDESFYVWKKNGDTIEKQFIVKSKITEENKIRGIAIVLGGLKPGDIILEERAN